MLFNDKRVSMEIEPLENGCATAHGSRRWMPGSSMRPRTLPTWGWSSCSGCGPCVARAHRQDGDYPPPTEHCDGLIDLRPGADEGGGHYRCPSCERIVYPQADRKATLDSILVHLQQPGVEAFLIQQLGELAVGRSFEGGVLALPVEGMNAAVCLVDYCTSEFWLGRGFGVNQRCVYVTVGPDLAPRMLREDAVAHVELMDIVLDRRDLRALLIERTAHVPALVSNPDIPVYSLGPKPIAPIRQDQPRPLRIFRVWLSPDGLLVNGLLTVRTTRVTAIGILRVLIRGHVEAVSTSGMAQPISADDLADAVQGITGGVQDADTMRRRISGMRKGITDAVRRHTGEPIGEHDIIETVSRSGADDDAEGYRLNPKSVALGPLEP